MLLLLLLLLVLLLLFCFLLGLGSQSAVKSAGEPPGSDQYVGRATQKYTYIYICMRILGYYIYMYINRPTYIICEYIYIYIYVYVYAYVYV